MRVTLSLLMVSSHFFRIPSYWSRCCFRPPDRPSSFLLQNKIKSSVPLNKTISIIVHCHITITLHMKQFLFNFPYLWLSKRSSFHIFSNRYFSSFIKNWQKDYYILMNFLWNSFYLLTIIDTLFLYTMYSILDLSSICRVKFFLTFSSSTCV